MRITEAMQSGFEGVILLALSYIIKLFMMKLKTCILNINLTHKNILVHLECLTISFANLGKEAMISSS